MKKLYIILISLFTASIINSSYSQSVLDPKDSVYTYNSNNPPTQPAWGQIGKWVRTVRVSWNSNSYKAYIYKGCAFRLKFPKSYNPNANDGKKYPMLVFFHGLGEVGPIYDNEYQLYHSGDNFNAAVNNGTFDGFILSMQCQGYWSENQYQYISEIIDYMIANNKLDPFHVTANGLSAGGEATWGIMMDYPTYISAAVPMSSSSINYNNTNTVNKIKFTPIWLFQGGLDGSPAPYTSHLVRDYILGAGGDITYTEYSDLGHGVWDRAWKEPDFYSYLLRSYSSNPWTLFGRTEFCANDAINLTIGVPPGFDEYQWSNHGVIINGASLNTINVKDTGTYAARVRRGSLWSDWSHTPAHIIIKTPTVTPPISVADLMSSVIPSADGKNYVNLQEQDNGYTSYAWKKVGSNTIIGTDRILKVTQPGDYIVAVTEQYGCSSIFSPAFHVANANGTNAPDAAKSLTALTLSNTQIELDWTNNPRPNYNETAFEVYRSFTQGGPYTFAGIVPADTLTFTNNGLTPNVKYYYKVRAINDNGAAALSNEATATTQSDDIFPTSPAHLIVTSTTNSTISLQWDSSTDNLGVALYEVYINGIKSYSTTQNSFIFSGLQPQQQFTFYVKAKDISGNYSPQSNQVSAATILQGLQYKYYEGTWNKLPDFNTLNSVKTGISSNTDISVRKRNSQFSFLWQGFIKIPVSGTYKFETYSEDGSRLWLGKYDATANPLVNNDGVHKLKYAAGSITLQAGIYPITIAYFNQQGSPAMSVYWTCSALLGDNNRHLIDAKYFVDSYTTPGTTPAKPSNLIGKVFSYNQIKLTWSDNSNNETGFEVYRSLLSDSGFTIVYTSVPNQTTYVDSALLPATKYYYKLIAINNNGSSDFSGKVSASTSAIPAAPAMPINFSAVAHSSSQILLSWIDKAINETGYTIYRSTGNANNFKQLALLPVNSNSYNDSSLFAHIAYYYKVVVNGVGGSSNSSSVVSATTGDNLPVITDLINRSAPYGATTAITITANDVDGDLLSYTILQKPSFATFTSNSNNTATLTLNPSSANQGVYNNIQVIVNDNNGGKDTTTFNLTINSNYDPTIDAISNYTLNEDGNVTISLKAHDQNTSDILTWSVTNAPNAFTLIPGANGSATLNLHPNFAAAGTYNVQVSVMDGKGGSAIRPFTVNVNEVDPNNTIYVRFKDQDTLGSPWNSITGITTNNLKDANNNTTTVGLVLQTSWFAAWHEGPNTNNNTGIYPDAVLEDYYYFGVFGGPETVTAKLTGLNPSLKYNLTFYAGSSWVGAPDNGTTTYTIGSQTVSLYVQNNTKNSVSLNGIVPASDGTVTFTMAKAANTPVGYLNSLVINSIYDDGSAPTAPKSLIAQNTSNQGVQLTWQDLAYNETGYEIYRSASSAGTYLLINTSAQNAINYFDTSARGNTQYYYKIRAINANGQSEYTDAATIVTLDRIPQISAINDIVLKSNQTLNVNVTANDDVTDHVSLTATGLPPFVTFTDNGNGTGNFYLQPTAGTIGYYPAIKIKATDNSDSSSTKSFNITITDNLTSSVYLNFSDGVVLANKPWNNLSGYPVAGKTFANIVDQDNLSTNINVTLVNGFQGVVASGDQPGNGKTIYPEAVLNAGEYEGTTTVRTIKVTGLSTTKKYNFIFFNSHEDGLNGLTNFTINGQTVSLNASYNVDKTVEINNISADANGQITVSIAKAAGADYAYLNAMVIQSYDPSVSILSPSDLTVTDTKRTSVSLQWADRSYNETGFQIWRADDSNSAYSLIKTVAANTVTYKDSNLVSNKSYYYIVKAINGSVSSASSNVVIGHTLAYAVYINFTTVELGHSPWNNTATPPQPGLVINNFYDETDHLSNVGFTDVSDFAGEYTAGMNTGNNSGIYPDSVMAESYGLFPGETGVIKITGLNLSMKYNFTFFASSQAYGDVTVGYTVNGKTVYLNASLNTKGNITMYNLTPDENGEVTISIAAGTSASQFGLIGALIVQGFDASTPNVPAPPNSQSKLIASGNTESIQKRVLQQNNSDIQIKAYPNPFISIYNLSVVTNKSDDAIVEMYNMAGKLVYSKKFNNLFKGENTLSIKPAFTTSGMYIVKVIFANEKVIKAIKILRQ